jgi:hypothetical protein
LAIDGAGEFRARFPDAVPTGAHSRLRLEKEAVITVTSLLWIWKGSDTAGRWYFITVPEEQSNEIRAHAFANPRGFRSVKVEARVGDISWRTSVFPLNSGGYLLPVKKEVRYKADIAAGDEVTVSLELL